MGIFFKKKKRNYLSELCTSNVLLSQWVVINCVERMLANIPEPDGVGKEAVTPQGTPGPSCLLPAFYLEILGRAQKKSLTHKSADGPEPCEAGVPLGVPETSSLEEDKIRKRKSWEVSTLWSSSPGTWKKLRSKNAGTRNAETTVHRRGTLLPRQMHEGADPLPTQTSSFLGSQTHSQKPPFPGSE